MLGCLVLAMTAGAALLSWIEPQSPSAGALPDPGILRDQASRAVGWAGDVDPGNWETIEIVSMAGADGPARLAATGGGRFHFIVSTSGGVQRGVAWDRQSRWAESPGAVLVGIEIDGENESLPLAEWLGLRALLTALADQVDFDGRMLEIGIRATAERNRPEWSRTLHAWLTYEGFLPPDR